MDVYLYNIAPITSMIWSFKGMEVFSPVAVNDLL